MIYLTSLGVRLLRKPPIYRLVLLIHPFLHKNNQPQKRLEYLVICLTPFGVIFLLSQKWYCDFVAVIFYSPFQLPQGNITRLKAVYHCEAIELAVRRIELKKALAIASAFFLVGAGGFEPPKSSTTDLQSAPFGHSGTLPHKFILFSQNNGAGGRTWTPDLLITNQLLYQLSYTSVSNAWI